MAAVAPARLGTTKFPPEFLTDANFSLAAVASEKSTYPMAPEVELILSATPVFFSAPTVLVGQLTVLPVPRLQSLAAARVRYCVKLAVVPEPSLRWTTVIAVDG